MEYTAHITISLKKGMLDPEANAIGHALSNLGFEIGSLSTARQFTISFPADSHEKAEELADQMCQRLLANPVIHHSTIEVTP